MEASNGSATSAEESRERLNEELKDVAREAENLARATGEELSARTRVIQERLEAALETAKAACVQIEEKAVAGVKATDRAIRSHPYQAIGIAFGVGLLFGFLIKRK